MKKILVQTFVQTWRTTSLAIALIIFNLSFTIHNSQAQCEFGFMESFGGSSTEYTREAIDIDSEGNIYLAGGFEGITKIDGITLVSNGGSDFFVAKFDANMNVIWARSLGGELSEGFNDIAVDDNGNIFVSGDIFSTGMGVNIPELDTTFYSSGASDIFIAKLDKDGVFIWASSYGNTQYEWNNTLQVGSNNNIYLSGTFRRDVAFGQDTLFSNNNTGNPTAAFDNMYLVKFDNDGNVLWVQQNVNNPADPGAQMKGGAIRLGANNDIYMRSTVADNGTYVDGLEIPNTALCLMKFDSDGNIQWVFNPSSNAKGLLNTKDITLDKDENILISGVDMWGVQTGEFVIANDTIRYEDGFFFVKLDSAGNVLWAKNANAGTTIQDGRVYPYGLITDEDNNIYMSGMYKCQLDFGSSAIVSYLSCEKSRYESFYCKFDSLLNPVWIKRLGSPDNTGLASDYSSILYSGGALYNYGTFANSAIYDNNDTLTVSSDDGSIDFFVLKYNRDGDIIPKDFAGNNKTMEQCDSAHLGRLDYAAYSYNWTPSTTTSSVNEAISWVTPTITSDYILRMTGGTSDVCTYYDTINVNVNEADYDVAFSASNRLFNDPQTPPFTVAFTNSTPNSSNYDFLWDFGDGETSTSTEPIHNYTANGLYTVTLIASDKITGCTDTLIIEDYIYANPNAIEEKNNTFFVIYPNPSNGIFTIVVSGKEKGVSALSGSVERSRNAETIIEIYSIDGKMVYNEYVDVETRHASSLHMSTDLNKGMYFIKISTENRVFTKKIIIN